MLKWSENSNWTFHSSKFMLRLKGNASSFRSPSFRRHEAMSLSAPVKVCYFYTNGHSFRVRGRHASSKSSFESHIT